MAQPAAERIDTLIVGAGPAGLAVAKELAGRGLAGYATPPTGLLREIGFIARRIAAHIAAAAAP
jgi:hypothetical protein